MSKDQKSKRRRPTLEPLENRQLLAGLDIDYQPDTRSLEITSDANGGRVQVSQYFGFVVATARDHNGRVVDREVVRADKVDRIMAQLGSGLDIFANKTSIPSMIRDQGGFNVLSGGSGNDTIHGGSGFDVIKGGGGSDHLYGHGGFDVIHGGKGPDRIWGGAGVDLITGGDGNDRLYGQGNRDVIVGGSGRDRIDGGSGHDVLAGGWHTDTYVVGRDIDRITERDGFRIERKGTGVLIVNGVNWGSASSAPQRYPGARRSAGAPLGSSSGGGQTSPGEPTQDQTDKSQVGLRNIHSTAVNPNAPPSGAPLAQGWRTLEATFPRRDGLHVTEISNPSFDHTMRLQTRGGKEVTLKPRQSTSDLLRQGFPREIINELLETINTTERVRFWLFHKTHSDPGMNFVFVARYDAK